MALEINFISSQQLKKIAEGKILLWKNDINAVLKEERKVVYYYEEDGAKVK